MGSVTTSDGVGLDRRSHGGSDEPAYGQRMSRPGKEARDVLDAVDLDEELAQVVVIDECGHAADIDQPELVNAAILEFLR